MSDEIADYTNDDAFTKAVEAILARDARYARGAYYFVRAGLDHAVKKVAESEKTPSGAPRSHVTGHQLLDGLRDYALEQYGTMGFALFRRWGITRSDDFGDIVYNLIDENILGRNSSDKREDFRGGFDLESELKQPFVPNLRTRLCVFLATLRDEKGVPASDTAEAIVEKTISPFLREVAFFKPGKPAPAKKPAAKKASSKKTKTPPESSEKNETAA